MKTVRDACQLQNNALSIKLSDQIEQLDELITSEDNGTAFFDKTKTPLFSLGKTRGTFLVLEMAYGVKKPRLF